MAKQKVFVPVPVSERLPEKDGLYIFIGGNGELDLWQIKDGQWWHGAWRYGELYLSKSITHWLEERELHIFTDEEADKLIAHVKLITFKSIDDILNE